MLLLRKSRYDERTTTVSEPATAAMLQIAFVNCSSVMSFTSYSLRTRSKDFVAAAEARVHFALAMVSRQRSSSVIRSSFFSLDLTSSSLFITVKRTFSAHSPQIFFEIFGFALILLRITIFLSAGTLTII